MNILIDATPVVYGERAVRRNARNLISRLLESDRGIHYILFYLDWRNRTDSRIPLPAKGLHKEFVLRLPGRWVEWSWRRFSLPTVESLVGNVDLVYGTDLIFPPSRRAVTVSTLHGIAYVAIPDLMTGAHVGGLSQALGYALREGDYLLAVSEHTKQEIVKLLKIPADRIRVSPQGVEPRMRTIEDKNRMDTILRERFGLQRPFLLYVGAISYLKNIPNLIEAFGLVASKQPDLSLVLAGPLENAYVDAAQLAESKGITSRVKFLGPLTPDGDDLLFLYNNAEILLHPSLYEGWTAPPLEAMACGAPVVASAHSSIPETCGGAAYLVDPFRPESIAEGILTVLRDEELRGSLIRRGYRRAGECHWSHCANRLESIFEELVASGRYGNRALE